MSNCGAQSHPTEWFSPNRNNVLGGKQDAPPSLILAVELSGMFVNAGRAVLHLHQVQRRRLQILFHQTRYSVRNSVESSAPERRKPSVCVVKK